MPAPKSRETKDSIVPLSPCEKAKQKIGVKPPVNEVFRAKQEELDDTMKEIYGVKNQVKHLREELERDDNFKRMIDSENKAKDQYRRLQ